MSNLLTEKIKIVAKDIKRIILGNRSDCDCVYCGYPMGCGDTAYTYAEETYCSKTCIYKNYENEV